MFGIYRKVFRDEMRRDGQRVSVEVEPVHVATIRTRKHATAYIAKALRRADARGDDETPDNYVIRNEETGWEYSFAEWADQQGADPWETED
jgi:hypothetical protein